MRSYFSVLFLCVFLFSNAAISQVLKPGFDKEEYYQLMLISTRTSSNAEYYNKFPQPKGFQKVYESQSIGLDNLWDLWTNSEGRSVISIRGTTPNRASWLANFYAAMVPAKGQLELAKGEIFNYELATNPRACVHVGWLLSMAILSKEIVPKIKQQYALGTKDFLLIGHSQGGAICYLLTAYVYSLQKNNLLPKDIRFKTYCSASPKPGNLYFAYDYEAKTQGGWAYNVVSSVDWVPEMPMSIQTLKDFNNVNPFNLAPSLIRKLKFPNNILLGYVYRQLDKPTRKAQRKYTKYLGKLVSKMVVKNVSGFQPPEYAPTMDYVRTGATIVLQADSAYLKKHPNQPDEIFMHHFHTPYLELLEKLSDDVNH